LYPIAVEFKPLSTDPTPETNDLNDDEKKSN
jgi:hypothetical protein